MNFQIFLMPDHNSSGFLAPVPAILNPCQPLFRFTVLRESPLIDAAKESPYRLEVAEILGLIAAQKTALALRSEDLLIRFTPATLFARKEGLNNLFLAGSTLHETPPRVACISSAFVLREILLSDPAYLRQRHAFYHLVVCSLLGAYLDMPAHSDRGCLLDFNNYTPDIHRKIDSGYSFCGECLGKVTKNETGESILRLCAQLKARGSLDVAGIEADPQIEFKRIKLQGEQSQAAAFEALCCQLYSRASGPDAVRRVSAPDGGVDIILTSAEDFIGIQCKYFVNGFGPAQKRQIQDSFTTAVANYARLNRYILVLPLTLTKRQQEDVFEITRGSRVQMTIIQLDNLVSMLNKEPDLLVRFFG